MNKRSTSRKSHTNWDKIDSLKDEDIDFSDIPALTPEMFANAITRKGFKPVPKNKKQVTLRIDLDVLNWFKSQGKGYQTKINSLLRAYMLAQKKSKS